MKDSQDLRTLLLQTDEEFRQLATSHQEMETRLQDLSNKSYLSQPEQIEQVTLKKRKLQLKDRMEDILRRYRRGVTAPVPKPHPTPLNGLG